MRVPDTILVQGQTSATGWRYEAREREIEAFLDPVSESQLAGRLLGAWLSQIEKELGYG